LFYPDISSVQGAMDLSGVHAVCIKHTEGTYYVNPDYAAQVAKAEAANAFCFAYHFLTNEDPTAQAKYCFDNVGSKVAVMADVETQTQTGSNPTLEQNVGSSRLSAISAGSSTSTTCRSGTGARSGAHRIWRR
jgi:GH25 family lysozyme M1 (1,4-beta-N-acetylmuramidase)